MPVETKQKPEVAATRASRAIAAEVEEWLAGLRTGEAQQLCGLELVPLVHDGHGEAGPELLAGAMGAGSLSIAEHGPGTVGAVVASNTGSNDVLVLEGESIVGAKQNRAVSLDVLVGAGTTVAIPVGCVERGRWSAAARGFRHSPIMMEPSLRAYTVAEMTTGGRLDQGRLWSQVEEKLRRSGHVSPTIAYHEHAGRMRREADEAVAALRLVPGQVGLLVLADGRLAGLDVVGHGAHWTEAGPRIARAYVLDALGRSEAVRRGAEVLPARAMDAPGWLSALGAAPRRARRGPGLGRHLALGGSALTGAALWHRGRPAHLAAFGIPGAPRSPRARTARAPRWERVNS